MNRSQEQSSKCSRDQIGRSCNIWHRFFWRRKIHRSCRHLKGSCVGVRVCVEISVEADWSSGQMQFLGAHSLEM